MIFGIDHAQFMVFSELWELIHWIFTVETTVAMWHVYARVGLPRAVALVTLIPGLGLFIVLAVLAFGRWPMGRPAGGAV